MCVDCTTEVFATACCGLSCLQTPAVRCTCSPFLRERRAPHDCGLLVCGGRAKVTGLCPGLRWWVRAEAATPCLPHMLLCPGTPLSWDPGLAALTLWCNVINFKSKLLFFSVLFHTNSLIPTREIQAAAKKKNGSLCPLILVDMCSF